MRAWRFDPGDGSDVLTIVDHASNVVPQGFDLGVAPHLLDTHIAWDIGAADLAAALGYPAFLASVSRLVIDFNREEDSPDRIPVSSDGIAIPGNGNATGTRDRLWRDYHDSLGARIEQLRPKLLLSLHSFTPGLASRPSERRPWQIGVLYNNDDRAAHVALGHLEKIGIVVGDQLPYSGRHLNATMNRHGERTGTPYLGLEVRQDLISCPHGVDHWARTLRPIIEEVCAALT